MAPVDPGQEDTALRLQKADGTTPLIKVDEEVLSMKIAKCLPLS